MAQDFTSTALLAAIKRRGMLPSTSETLSTSDFLAIATEVLQGPVINTLIECNEGYGLDTYDVSTVAGTSAYALPTRASASVLQGVYYDFGDGAYLPLAREEVKREGTYGISPGTVARYAIEDDEIVLLPTPSSSGTLRLKYPRRPGSLVATTAVGVVSAISVDRKTITLVASKPSTFTTTAALDFISSKPIFATHAIDWTPNSSASGTSLVSTTAVDDAVVVGDYVALAGESPVPQVPVEMHAWLAQLTAAECLLALGDSKSDKAFQRAAALEKDVRRALNPRVQSGPRYIVNRNGPGW